jgi:RNA polymerase sigma factor (sigma-70 family)
MAAPQRTLRLVAGDAAAPAKPPDGELVAMVRAAVAGDGRALECLVARYDRTLRGTARSYGLRPWDVDDVVQNTWIQFLEHGAKLREPAAVSGWLMTTARRHCLRALQSRVREHLCEDPASREACQDGRLDADLLAAERRTALAASLARLTQPQRELIALLIHEPELSYEEIGERLGRPIGSIGPTRARSLSRLRRDSRLQALM